MYLFKLTFVALILTLSAPVFAQFSGAVQGEMEVDMKKSWRNARNILVQQFGFKRDILFGGSCPSSKTAPQCLEAIGMCRSHFGPNLPVGSVVIFHKIEEDTYFTVIKTGEFRYVANRYRNDMPAPSKNREVSSVYVPCR